jgi:Ser/Thr protein kinase RdoA (MazF antagonist)
MIRAWNSRRRSFRLVHGDFTPYNVLIRSGGITFIDLGNALEADPLLDVASFVSQLELIGERKRLPEKRSAQLSKHFLQRYQEAVRQGTSTRSALAAYQSYRAWWLMQAAAYLVSTQPIQKNEQLLHSIFTRTRRLLS